MVKARIVNKTSKEIISQRLRLDFKNGYINSEQWFSKPELWYELTAFSNPYITVYSELILLSQNLKATVELLKNRALIFYGLGTGDTEIIIVNALLKEQRFIEILGIDVQRQFIKGFIQSLKNIALEDTSYKINFVGINGLFQDISKKDIKTKLKQAHVILGNTIGNFNEDKIFNIFGQLMNKGDILFVGFQTDKKIEKTFRQYSENKMFNSFILKTVSGVKKLKWRINRKEHQIEAWDDGVLVFHSKKKNPTNMIKCAKSFGFSIRKGVNDDNTCLQVFEKI